MRFLAVLKPDGVIRKAAGAGILKGLLDSGLCEFLSFKKVLATKELLAEHYKHLSQKPFFPWLLVYMSSFPSYVIFIKSTGDQIGKMRLLLGATKAHAADPASLRFQYCPYGGLNGLHLSEDEVTGDFETGLWKRHLGVSEGQFDLPIGRYIAQYSGKPNHTKELRRLFSEIASDKSLIINYQARIMDLLREESADAPAEHIEYLYQAFIDSFE